MDAIRACTLIILLGAAWLGLSALANEPRLSVAMHGRYAYEPADWSIIVRVQPQPEDRWLEAIADGTAHYRSSGYELAGENAPRIHQLFFSALAAGCYVFRVEIRRRGPDGPVVARAVAPSELSVFGFGVDGDPCS